MSIKTRFKPVQNAWGQLNGHPVLQFFVIVIPIVLLLLIYFLVLFSLNLIGISLNAETFNFDNSDKIQKVIVLAIIVIVIIFLIIKYFLTDDDRKTFFTSFKEIGIASYILAMTILIFSAMSLKTDLSIIVQIATIFTLAFAGISFVESLVLGKRVQKIFGFHSYVKNGADVYSTAKEWTYSIVSNWEVSKQIQNALERLDNRKATDGNPILVSFCGPINCDNFLGILWRIGVWQDITNKPNMSFHVPRDSNTPRFAINEQEVLLASSPTDEKRDLYGFLKRDATLAVVYKRIYSQLIATNNVYEDIGKLLSKDSRMTPFGLGKGDIDIYIERYIEKIALPTYLDQLKKDGLDHKIEKKKDREDALQKIRKGIDHILIELEVQRKVELEKDLTVTPHKILLVKNWLI